MTQLKKVTGQRAKLFNVRDVLFLSVVISSNGKKGSSKIARGQTPEFYGKFLIFSVAKLFLPCSNVNEILSFLDFKVDQKIQTD